MHTQIIERTSGKEGPSALARYLKTSGPIVLTVYAALAAFCLYTCVYAFRKSFAAATFTGIQIWNVDYKVWLVCSQVIGYALSKFIGIRFIAEVNAFSRKQSILIIIVIAGLSWLGFAVIPMPFNMIFMFINGLVLGLVWGLIFGYLEGRTITEILGAALSVSFIFSSGLCRSAGALVLSWDVSEYWMPFVVATIFTFPLLIFLHLLDQIPTPTKKDIQLRTARAPMGKKQRKEFVRRFLPGIIFFVLAYMLLTTLRDFRDNFSAEIFHELRLGDNPGIYTQTEVPISIAVLIVMGMMIIVRNNRLALLINHLIIFTGMLLIAASTLAFDYGHISPIAWMTLLGLGLYLGYVPFNSIFFDRMLAAFQYVGTVGFIMYVADAFGYMGSVATLLIKEFSNFEASWLTFLKNCAYLVAFLGGILILASMHYFHTKKISE